MIKTLVQRLVDAQAKNKLEALLKRVKTKNNADLQAYKTTGTPEELFDAVQSAIVEHHLTERDVANLVDSVEENGGQHIFLFTLTDVGRQMLTAAAFENAFPTAPAKPTEAFYAQYPATTRTHYEFRNERTIVIKQVYTTTFWQKNREKSKDSENQRIVIFDRINRRSINLFKIDLPTGEVEVRVDRVHGQDDEMAAELLEDFKTALIKLVNFEDHLLPVPVVKAFPGILAARDETFMTVDEAFDPAASMRFANNREDAKGKDIRDHGAYADAIAKRALGRESLRVYWLYNNQKLHSIISTLEVVDSKNAIVDYGKVFINAKLEPDELNHVLDRVRHFAI